jgi:hypothetical protein
MAAVLTWDEFAVVNGGKNRRDLWGAASEEDVQEYQAFFPAIPEAVAVARAFARAAARASQEWSAEIEVLASELASSVLGKTGSVSFSVTVRRSKEGVRLEAAAYGGGWWPIPDEIDEITHACRLMIISSLADRFGHYGTTGGTAALWAEMIWAERAAPE